MLLLFRKPRPLPGLGPRPGARPLRFRKAFGDRCLGPSSNTKPSQFRCQPSGRSRALRNDALGARGPGGPVGPGRGAGEGCGALGGWGVGTSGTGFGRGGSPRSGLSGRFRGSTSGGGSSARAWDRVAWGRMRGLLSCSRLTKLERQPARPRRARVGVGRRGSAGRHPRSATAAGVAAPAPRVRSSAPPGCARRRRPGAYRLRGAPGDPDYRSVPRSRSARRFCSQYRRHSSGERKSAPVKERRPASAARSVGRSPAAAARA